MFMKNGFELANQIGLDPYHSHDPYGDKDADADGLSNIFEYKHDLNLNEYDTDRNGIDEGSEYYYWQKKLKNAHSDCSNEMINDTAISYCMNPDVDHDIITNGKEIKVFKEFNLPLHGKTFYRYPQ